MQHGLALDRPVTAYLSDAAFTLREGLTMDEALGLLRAGAAQAEGAQGGGGESVGGVHGRSQVIYFYVVDDAGRLVGVLPSRYMVLAPGAARVSELMVREIVVMRGDETLADALELFAMHRLLAIPVVDEGRRFLGVVEVSLYTDEVFDLAQNRELNEVFQLIGLHLEQHKQGSAWRGFRLRMPWLLSNITGGLVCAALGSFFETTVSKVVLIALFIPLILTLAESIAVQSMTLAIEQATMRRKFAGQVGQEILTAVMLGLASGVIVGLVSLFWEGPRGSSVLIAGAVAGAMFVAAMLGRTVPKGVHFLRLNPRIASGPITLAIVDVVTITLYLSAAAGVFGR